MEKKIYQAPEMEVVELMTAEAVLLTTSGEEVPWGGEGDPDAGLD